MAKFEVGNMWEAFESADHFIVCLSSTVSASGNAVLNKGMAAELLQRFPEAGLASAIGGFILKNGGNHGIFGVQASGKIGVLQTCRRFQDPTDLNCVGTGLRMLTNLANANPDQSYHVEMPGTDVPYFLVKGPVEMCPDNITFWSRP
ncbi:phosphatase [Pseudomonas phage Ka3]|nr:hypothetical protein [Pseudomonas phage vB_Pae-PA152]WQZ52431.1 phosphatase [Pseudomonas phage Ka3]